VKLEDNVKNITPEPKPFGSPLQGNKGQTPILTEKYKLYKNEID